MDTATHSAYTIQTTDHDERVKQTRPSQTGSADTIHGALDAAWALNRYTESDVDIVSNDDPDHPRVVARLSLEWLEG